jgi:hypothetical protein
LNGLLLYGAGTSQGGCTVLEAGLAAAAHAIRLKCWVGSVGDR